MHKEFEVNQTKIKGGCQSYRKAATHNSKNDLPLVPLQKSIEVDWYLVTKRSKTQTNNYLFQTDEQAAQKKPLKCMVKLILKLSRWVFAFSINR